jgi:hypothetical protein
VTKEEIVELFSRDISPDVMAVLQQKMSELNVANSNGSLDSGRQHAQRKFPKSFKIGGGTSVWSDLDISEWIDSLNKSDEG